MRRLGISSILIVGLLTLGNTLAVADQPADTPADREVVSITVRPAAPPEPALRYRLLPTPVEQHPGNAAPQYLKAFLLLADAKVASGEWDKIAAWESGPLEKLPREEVRATLVKFEGVLHQTELAALRTHCEWEPPIREEQNIFAILLPEMQSARSVARLLAVRVRLRLAEGNPDAALADLRVGYTLARHTAANPFLVSGLVGLSVAGLMHDQLETLIQTPGAPNLYWALTAFPDPPIGLHAAMDMEAATVPFMFPELQDPQTIGRSAEQWTKVLARLTQLLSMEQNQSSAVPLSLTVGAALPGAKQRLLAAGMSPPEVEALAPAQALLIQSMKTFDCHRDAMFKWFHLPYWQAAAGLRQAEADLQRAKQEMNALNPDVGLILAGMLLPALHNCARVEAQGSRRLGELRAIEALRAYAAGHGGKLPAKLDDLADLPLPMNAVTGKPFAYRLDGDTAVLGGDDSPNGPPREYRLKMAK